MLVSFCLGLEALVVSAHMVGAPGTVPTHSGCNAIQKGEDHQFVGRQFCKVIDFLRPLSQKIHDRKRVTMMTASPSRTKGADPRNHSPLLQDYPSPPLQSKRRNELHTYLDRVTVVFTAANGAAPPSATNPYLHAP